MSKSSDQALTMNANANQLKAIRWAVVAGLLMAVVTLFLPNYYKSEAKLLPVDSKGTSGLGNLAAVLGMNVPGTEGLDANFVDVLNSRWLREQLLQTEFHYRRRTWRFGAERLERGTLYTYLDSKNMDRALRGLGTVLSASRDVKSKVISISAETKSPELSQLIVQRASKLLEVFLQEKGRTRGGAKAVFASARLVESRKEMDEAEDALRRFLEVNRNVQGSADPAVRLKGNRLETELRLRQQLVNTLSLNREQALLEEKNDIPILNVLDPGNLPIEKSRPTRSTMVVVTTILVGLGTLLWSSRKRVREWLQFPSRKFDPRTRG